MLNGIESFVASLPLLWAGVLASLIAGGFVLMKLLDVALGVTS